MLQSTNHIERMGTKAEALAQPIRQQIVKAVEAGVWSAGSKLPSTREMGREMNSDPRDVAAVYQQLALEGLVELRPRSGAYVSGNVGKASIPPGLAEGWIASVLADAISREISAPDLSDWLHRAVGTVRLSAFVIAPSTDQVRGLCSELERSYGLEASGKTTNEIESSPNDRELRRADFVVTTEASAEIANKYAAGLELECISVAVRPDIMSDTWRTLLRRRTAYVVMMDAKFDGVLATFFARDESVASLNRLVVGRDDLSVIPHDAVVYVTQAARAALGDTKLNGFILPPARVLSLEASREILRIIVRENFAALRGRRGEGRLPVGGGTA